MIVPRLHVTPDRLNGCSPWPVRALTLFSFSRCVAVDRRLRHVVVETRRLWTWTRVRVVDFDHIHRIVYRAQLMPSLDGAEPPRTAAFFIALALKGTREEVRLFTVWESQPRDPDLLDRIAGARAGEIGSGDAQSRRIVTLLREYIGVPIGR